MSDEETKATLYPPPPPDGMPMHHVDFVQKTSEWTVKIHKQTATHHTDDSIKNLFGPVMKEQIKQYLSERSGKFSQIFYASLTAFIQAAMLIIAWLALGK